MAKIRKMLGKSDSPYINSLMCLIETQSKLTIAEWCISYTEEHILPIFEKECPSDFRPRKALSTARDRLAGKVKFPVVKHIILHECHAAARELDNNPVAQAAARACGQAAAVLHTPTHSLGLAFYGSAAIVYNRLGLNETEEIYDQCAAEECAKMEAALRVIAKLNNMDLPIKSERLYIAKFDNSMAESVHINSLDDDNRRFVPDEVFETVAEAQEIIDAIVSFYSKRDAPLIYAVMLNNGQHIGHVQAVPIPKGWEIGYHIAKPFTGNGYATEAVNAFLPLVMHYLGITQIDGLCHADNIASCKVLEKCGFTLEYNGMGQYQGNEQHICRYIKKT